jgi:hypothetical protein
LQSVLQQHDNWGNFHPDQKGKVKSTRFWVEYPFLNAKIDGEFMGEKAKITIAVNWYQSDGDYPYYMIKLESDDSFISLQEQFEWKSEFDFRENELRYYPDPDDFNIERDFKKLIKEFSRFLREY